MKKNPVQLIRQALDLLRQAKYCYPASSIVRHHVETVCGEVRFLAGHAEETRQAKEKK